MYADVTVATKSNRMRTIPDRPTISSAEPELNVEYSAINFKLCNKKSVMEQHPSHGMMHSCNNYQQTTTYQGFIPWGRGREGGG